MILFLSVLRAAICDHPVSLADQTCVRMNNGHPSTYSLRYKVSNTITRTSLCNLMHYLIQLNFCYNPYIFELIEFS